MRGVVKRIVADRGFGFIEGADGKDVFFHATAVRGAGFDELTEDLAVEYEAVASPKGPKATSVSLT